MVLSLCVSLVLPKRYTATAEILIQPPAGNDPRAATAISPVYLESLKAYQRLAESDTLFERAIEKVNAGRPGSDKSIESLKRSILRVNKPANTAMLDISATMTDPRKAQALAQFVAEQTVEMSRSIDSKSEKEASDRLRAQVEVARTRLVAVQTAARDARSRAPLDSSETLLANDADLLLAIDKETSLTRTEIAGYKSEASAPDSEKHGLLAAAEARLASLASQSRELAAAIAGEQKRVEDFKALSAQIQAEEDAAQAAYDSAGRRLDEVNASGQFRGERLRLIDPGIVPQEPRSPNIPLNVMAALLFSLGASLAFIWAVPRSAFAPQSETEASEPALIFRR